MTLGPLMVDLRGYGIEAAEREMLQHPMVGGVILFTRNFDSVEQLRTLVRDIHEVRTPPLLIAVDHEGGRVQRFRKEFTIMPSMRLIGRTHAIDAAAGRKLAHQCGWLMAAELRAVGIDFSFAPVVDLDYGVSDVIGDRSFGQDPRVVAELAIAFMGGMRQAGMAATAKHFPGHGAVRADSHVALPVDRRPYVDMADDLYPYQRLIDNGLPAVMASHVVYSEIDARPAGFSKLWLQEELRGRMGFNGAIFSDDLSMEGASVMGDMPERARAALAAGCDVLPICNNPDAVLVTLDALKDCADPLSQIRLVRLHGRTGPSREELLSSTSWLEARQAVQQCLDKPDFALG